ncbi:hypothetical protein J14TS2_18490 [Bacillus sp. J14TS2]|nr:hypothetical protein J14TS2_18490 [Bacillus sp. J14TS2]
MSGKQLRMQCPNFFIRASSKRRIKRTESVKNADVLSATPTLVHPVRRKFEAAKL